MDKSCLGQNAISIVNIHATSREVGGTHGVQMTCMFTIEIGKRHKGFGAR